MSKVLLVSPRLERPSGGMAVWTELYLSECERYGLTVSLLNTALTGRRAEKASSRRSVFDEFRRSGRIFRELRRLLRNDRFDIAHINTSCATFGIIRDYLIVRKVKRSSPSTRIVVHFHCNIENQIKYAFQRTFLKKLLRLSGERIVLNRSSAEYISDICRQKTVTVPNGIPGDYVIKTPKHIRNEIKRVAFVGFVTPQKGAYEIFELARKLPDMDFLLAGEVSDEVKAHIRTQNVRCLGALPRERVTELLDEADVFLFPTHSEGFSMALTEAMARGVPVITTDTGANRDMIGDKGGVVVPIGDADRLFDAFQYMKDPKIRAGMSEWLTERVRSSYTVEAVMSELSRIYKDKCKK